MGNKIQLFGELESVAVDKKLVDAVQVKDSAWIDPTTKNVSEETQSAINAALKQMAENAAKTASDLKLGYDPTAKLIKLYIGEDNSENPISSISSSDFTKDGMIETVLGPVTPVWDDVTDKVAAGTKTEKAKWAVAEDTGEQAFFALDVPTGYLLIQEITLGNTYLGFIWNTNTDANKTEGKVYDSENFKASALDVSTLIDTYTSGEGLKLENNQFSIKLGEQTEGYLAFDDDNYLVIRGVNEKIANTVETAKTDLQSSIASLRTKIESDYKKADADLLGKTNDPSSKDTIYGVRNYATNVARLMGGYNMEKTVEIGSQTVLWANHDVTKQINLTGYKVDLESISVRLRNTGELIDVAVRKSLFTTDPVVLIWSGIAPTSDSPFIINYRVILSSSTGE